MYLISHDRQAAAEATSLSNVVAQGVRAETWMASRCFIVTKDVPWPDFRGTYVVLHMDVKYDIYPSRVNLTMTT